MTNYEYRELEQRYKRAKTSKTINDSCVFAKTHDGCKCGALTDYYCDGCKFYKSKDEYAIDEGGFVHRKEEANGKYNDN